MTVRPANDAPTRLLASVSLAASPEDALNPSQATVTGLFNGAGANAAFSDATDQVLVPGGSLANNLAGVVIVGNTANAATEGVWQYSADGAAWTTVTNAVATNAGVFITANYQLRFVPVADYSGTPPGLTVRLVDDSAVTPALPAAGATNVDVTTSGGKTRYSDNANAVTLTTHITAVNDVPVAIADTGTTAENDTLIVPAAGGVLSNDTDVDSSDTHSVSAVNGVAGNVGNPVTGSNGGSFTLAADGSYTFNPETAFDYLAVGQAQTTSVIYTNLDSNGGTATTTLTITVTGVNDAPVAGNDAAPPVFIGNTPSVNVLANDSDAEDGRPAIIDLDPGTAGIQSTFTNADGTFIATGGVVTFTPANPAFVGSTSLNYVAIDSAGADSNVGVASFSIIPAPNTAPVAVNDNAPPVTVGNNPSVNVLANDSDAEDGRPTVIDLDPGTAGIQSTFTNADGTFTATGGVVTFTPANPAFAGSTSLNYVAIDSAGAVSNVGVAGFSIIPAPNTAPVAVNDNAAPVTVGNNPSVNVLANDSDAEDGRPAIIDLDPGTAGIQSTFTNADGTFTATGGLVTFTPANPAFAGSTSLNYMAIDSAGADSNVGVASFSIIPAPNTAPVAVNDNAPPVTAGNIPSVNVLANDSDAEDGRPTVIDLDPGTPGIQSSFTNADGTFTATGGVVTFTPANPAFAGSTSLNYVAIDSAGAVSNLGVTTFSITAAPGPEPVPNTAPLAVNDSATPVTVGNTPSVNVLANDSDAEDGRPALVDLDPGTPGIQSTFTNADGTFTAAGGVVTFTPA